jgi:hypothetical protein
MNSLCGKPFDLADNETEFGVDVRDDDQMDMLGHDYISENTETCQCFHFADGINDNAAELVARQKRDSFVSAEGDESGAAIMIKVPEFHAGL